MMTNQHPMLPTQEQLAEWDSEYFDGEGQNFDFMMIKAFQAGCDKGTDWQLEQCVEELERLLSIFGATGVIKEEAVPTMVELFKANMRPQEDN